MSDDIRSRRQKINHCVAIMDEKGRGDGFGSRSMGEDYWAEVRTMLVSVIDDIDSSRIGEDEK
ncbi:MAG: hypothetical protein JKY86_15450 [Gammaproteobacteria bacterium]|nr:hypothetical protein [Gammaproteobacteria bacterium]